ncbi:H(+)/Cl(-) exchange transporter 3 [Porphyridium purpureum]|uniref:Chloride channel protein n=1 Tax=Porphyridium purpureum TaxID=35688 RepID=A0A5J4YIA1_PORPP|nr:H(+)/Cl(-) exchange transporter 3 [Porphyridium purpureum]|eukprot:POR2198..scf261_15
MEEDGSRAKGVGSGGADEVTPLLVSKRHVATANGAHESGDAAPQPHNDRAAAHGETRNLIGHIRQQSSGLVTSLRGMARATSVRFGLDDLMGSRRLQNRKRRRHERSGPDHRNDFEVIDWTNERYFTRPRYVNWDRLRTMQLYTLLTLIGVLTAMLAVGLDVIVEWLGSIRKGVCLDAPHLPREVCCSSSRSFEECTNFMPWSAIALQWGATSSHAVIGYGMMLFFSVGMASSAAFLVLYLAPYAAGSGIPEVKAILNGVRMNGFLAWNTLVVKATGLALCTASGLNLGKEGPFVHLASCVAFGLIRSVYRIVGKRPNERTVREIISSSAAAGVAVAFDAPIGGVLFSLEEVSSHFEGYMLWRTLYCAAVGALALTFLRPRFNARLISFEVQGGDLPWQWFELIPFAFLGLLGGLIGVAFINLNVLYSKFRMRTSWYQKHPVAEVALLAGATVILSSVGSVYNLSNSLILTTVFQPCSVRDAGLALNEQFHLTPLHTIMCDTTRVYEFVGILTYGIVLKFLLTALTFGAKIPAGLFVPSLTIGALLGRAMGSVMFLLHRAFSGSWVFQECIDHADCVEPAIYATVGAASVLAGVTQVSVSLVVMVFELTGEVHHLLPVMLAVMFSKMVCASFDTGSIYEEHITLKRLPFLPGNLHLEVFSSDPSSSVHSGSNPSMHRRLSRMGGELDDCSLIMSTAPVCIRDGGSSLADVLILCDKHPLFHGFPIIDADGRGYLRGYITRRNVEEALSWERHQYWRRHGRSRSLGGTGTRPTESVNFVDLKAEVLFDVTACQMIERSDSNGSRQHPSASGDVTPVSISDAPNYDAGEEQHDTMSSQWAIGSLTAHFGLSLDEPTSVNPDAEGIPLIWAKWVDHFLPMVLPSTPILAVYDLFVQMGVRHALVVEDGLVKGILTKKDLLRYIDERSCTQAKYFF